MNRRSFFSTTAALLCAATLPPVKLDYVPAMITPGEFVINRKAINVYAHHIQRINVSTKLGREPLPELGRGKPYYYYSPPTKS